MNPQPPPPRRVLGRTPPGPIVRYAVARAFTLTELLIVVAIIAILAAAAIPSLNRALTRARVSRAAADMRTLSGGIEAYQVDWNRLPMGSAGTVHTIHRLPEGYIVLTTPIAYMGNNFDTFVDPFGRFNAPRVGSPRRRPSGLASNVLFITNYGSRRGAFPSLLDTDKSVRDAYIIGSVGPDQEDDIFGQSWGVDNDPYLPYFIPYDPSNGVTSIGDLYRTGGRIPQWFKEAGWPLTVPSGN